MKPKEQRKSDEGAAKFKARYQKNANYDANQDEPSDRMGSDSFANMPNEVIMKPYAGPLHRDGIINSFSADVSKMSDIDENRKKTKPR